jgi:ACR3 family arsenite transporter
VVGVLIEVPVMLSAVWIVNNTRSWYEGGGQRGGALVGRSP